MARLEDIVFTSSIEPCSHFLLRENKVRTVVALCIVKRTGQLLSTSFRKQRAILVGRDVFCIPKKEVNHSVQSASESATRGSKGNLAYRILVPKDLIHQRTHAVNILIADLHKHAAGLREQVAGHHQPIAQVGEVGVDTQLPSVAEGAHLFGLAGGVLGLAVFHVALAGAHLPVGAELDAIGRIEVNGLHLALEAFLLGQRGHHKQRIAQDESVGPVLLVVVKVDLLREVSRAAVEVGEEARLVATGLLGTRQRVDDRLRVNLLLDVDRHHGNGEVFAVLLVLALPDQLRIERGIARVEHRLGCQFFIGHKVAQLLCGNVGALVLMADGFNFLLGVLLSHVRLPLLALCAAVSESRG